ncbi:MAG: TetR/AcrR family transcriptional regulator [Deltaproteobacteria bacterium]|nr:MAG: TetR/AcrR family transcriptional regulator [Deltaproteobacteria bacterium]
MNTLSIRKKPKQLRSMNMLNDIYSGVLRGVQKYGLENLSTTKISKLTGISVGSFYQYFINKESLFLELSKHLSLDISNELNQLITDSKFELNERVEMALSRYIDYFFEHEDFFKVLYSTYLTNGFKEKVLERRKVFCETLANELSQNSHKSKEDCLIFATCLINSVNGALHMFAQDSKRQVTKNEIKAFLIQSVRNSINIIQI